MTLCSFYSRSFLYSRAYEDWSLNALLFLFSVVSGGFSIAFVVKIVSLGKKMKTFGENIRWVVVSAIAITTCQMVICWPMAIASFVEWQKADEQLSSTALVTVAALSAFGIAVNPICYALSYKNFRLCVKRVATACFWRPHAQRQGTNLK